MLLFVRKPRDYTRPVLHEKALLAEHGGPQTLFSYSFPLPRPKQGPALVLQFQTNFYFFPLKKTSTCRRDLTIQIPMLNPIFKFHPLLLIVTL